MSVIESVIVNVIVNLISQKRVAASIVLLLCFNIVGCASFSRSPGLLDDDNDSISNANDICPGTLRQVVVDDQGCALFQGTIEGVEFAAGDYRLVGSSRDALTGLVDELNTHSSVLLGLAGHTDNRGSAAANLELSKKRVMAVVKFLVSNGIEAERLRPIGYGESRPLHSNSTKEGRKKNRRIEMSVFTR